MRDQTGRWRRQLALPAQIEHRPIDEIDGAAPGDLRVGLDVGDEQLDGGQIAGDRLAKALRQYEGNKLECCVPGA